MVKFLDRFKLLCCWIRFGWVLDHHELHYHILIYQWVVIRGNFDWVVHIIHQMDEIHLLIYLYVVIRVVD